MTQHSLPATESFQGSTGSSSWRGRQVTDKPAFAGYLKKRVHPRLRDDDGTGPIDSALQALASTGMATTFLAKLLKAIPEPQGWEIGEALAECVLQDNFHDEVFFPWNTVRDRRTPRASLPGADLVGFLRRNEAVFLLFGEVKTSSDKSTPPNVMYGSAGMVWQLEESATRLDVQGTLLVWLHRRCLTKDHQELFRSSVTRFLNSSGKDLLLVGVLVRDTTPDEKDVRARATALANALKSPTTTELVAWYLPEPISNWAAICKTVTP